MQDSTKLEVEGGELLIKNSKGIMAVIPRDRVDYVKDLIERKNFDAVDKYVQTLEVLKRRGGKAEDGGVIDNQPKDWGKFRQFNATLPSNLRDDSFQYGDRDKYDLYGMWQASGKPASFEQVKDTELFPKQEDGTYHGFSVGDDGVWLKPKSHPTAFMEYSSTQLDPSMQHMRVIQREDGRLQYIPKTPFLDVVASYKKSMESPTYKQRLARELYGDAPADMGEVEKNFQKRQELLKNLKLEKEGDLGTGVVGQYFPEQHTVKYNPKESETYQGTESVLAHEVGHALDTELLDAFTGKKSAFTNKKTELFGNPADKFENENSQKINSLKWSGIDDVVNTIKKDVAAGRLNVIDKEKFDKALKSTGLANIYGTDKIIGDILQQTDIDNDYYDKLEKSGGFKKLNEYNNYKNKINDLEYLNRDTEVKAKINALRIKANLQHGYKFDEPFDIKKYPTLKSDINYQQLNKELGIPDEAINKLSEYVAYEPKAGQEKATAKNGVVIPLAKFNASVKSKSSKPVQKAEDGIVIAPPSDPPVKPMAPAESTGNIAGSIARVNYRLAQRDAEKERLYQEAIRDKSGTAEEAFVKRYNTSPHRYKYDTDPEYRKQVDKNAEETSKRFGSIDIPATDVRSRKYSGNPNLAFMTQKGMSKEGRRALEESNLEIIGAALPIPGVETVGKLPSLLKLGGKIANRNKVGATSWNGPLLDDLFKDLGMPAKPKINQFEADTPAGMTLEAFKTRIQSPEGIRRLNELGITEKEFLQEIQLLKNRKTHGDYTRSTNEINLDPFSPLPKTVTRHEIEHAVQNAIAKSAKKELPNLKASDYGTPEYNKVVRRAMNISDIDHSLMSLDLKDVNDLPEGFSKTIRVSDLNQPSAAVKPRVNTDLLVGLGDDRAALDYFTTGSAGSEPSAFLGEVQEHMVNTGIIKDPYQKITVNDVKTAYTLDEGKYADRKLLRLFNIIKPTERNFQLIADNLNKMLSLTGATVGAGAAVKKANEQNEK